MEEFATCDQCRKIYDSDTRCPRMLICGHSFCSICILKLMDSISKCPTCETSFEKGNIKAISINYSLMKLAKKFLCEDNYEQQESKMMKEEKCSTDSNHQDILVLSAGFCKTHHLPKRFRCITCHIWVCCECITISHSLCKTLPIINAIEQIKKEESKKIKEHIEMAPKYEVDTLGILHERRKLLKEKNEELQSHQTKINALIDEICKLNVEIKKVVSMQTVLSTVKEKLENQQQIINATSNAKELDTIVEKLAENFKAIQEIVLHVSAYKSISLHQQSNENMDCVTNKENLLAVVSSDQKVFITTKENEETRYGKLDMQNGQLMIHSVKQDPPPSLSLCLTIDQCLTSMTGRREWPRNIFIQFACRGNFLGSVTIHLNETAKEASKAVLRTCLFTQQGASFKGMGINLYGSNAIGPKLFLSVPSDVDSKELLREATKKSDWKEGEFALHVRNGSNGMEFWFNIWVEGCNQEREFIPTGEVTIGMEVCRDVLQKIRKREKVKIIDVGWIC